MRGTCVSRRGSYSPDFCQKTHCCADFLVCVLPQFINPTEGTKPPQSPSAYRRLAIFDTLSQGMEVALNRRLPHIHRDSPYGKENKASALSDDTSARCWKALLLPSEELCFANEWELVQEHFDKSRSKKVLSIIQQK